MRICDCYKECTCNANDAQYRDMKRSVDGSKVGSTTQVRPYGWLEGKMNEPKPESVGITYTLKSNGQNLGKLKSSHDADTLICFMIYGKEKCYHEKDVVVVNNYTNVYEREIWNAAIEAAAQMAEIDHRSEIAKSVNYEPEFHKAERKVAEQIRKLKK